MLYYKRLIALFLFMSVCGLSYSQPEKQVKAWLQTNSSQRSALEAQSFAKSPLNKKQASEIGALFLSDAYAQQRTVLEPEWKSKVLILGKDSLKFDYKIFGERPAEGRSLYISMHGGGNAPAQVNDQQWRNQIRLYTPAEGIYVAPRAPTNTWNLWHEEHIDPLFDRLILAAILFERVNPNKVYLMGYSAGGDGVYQLAPRMADRLAAAAMMAGHPNETTPDGLRNIGFTIHMGAVDSAYNRNRIAKEWGLLLDSLQQRDPGGYKHLVQLHEGRPHWMNREDTVAVPWMAAFRRNATPDRIVWKQDDVHHGSFYWLAVPKDAAQTGGIIVATLKGNEINIESSYTDSLFIRINDRMMDLDKPVIVKWKGNPIFKGKVKRNAMTLYSTTQDRLDPNLIFPVELEVQKGKINQVMR